MILVIVKVIFFILMKFLIIKINSILPAQINTISATAMKEFMVEYSELCILSKSSNIYTPLALMSLT